MQRCAAEAYPGTDKGKTPADRSKQAAAMCFSQWREAHGGTPPKANAMIEYMVYDAIGEGESTAKALVQALRDIKPADPITIAIFSPGGSIFEAEAMFAAIKRHKGHVTARIDGVAASAASYLAMAADEIVMAPGSHLMLHNPSVSGYMSATESDLRDILDRFDTITKQMVRVYAQRSGQDEARVRDLMAKETWLTAEQAAQMGFCDRIDDGLELKANVVHFEKFGYRHTPVAVMAQNATATMAAEPPAAEEKHAVIQLTDEERQKRANWRRREVILAELRKAALKSA